MDILFHVFVYNEHSFPVWVILFHGLKLLSIPHTMFRINLETSPFNFLLSR